MNIAIIGTGSVGKALAKGWLKAGHHIRFGSRTPSNAHAGALQAELHAELSIHHPAEAVKDAQIVVLAVPWHATSDTLDSLGDMQGKIIIDAINPLGGEGLLVGHDTSAAEFIQARTEGARVVKAFNCTGSANMENPDYQGQAVTMFIAGDDTGAKVMVSSLASELGFEVIDVGGLALARALEPLAQLWVQLAYQRGMGMDIAFKLLTR